MDREMRERYVASLIMAGGKSSAMVARDIERFYMNQFESNNLEIEPGHLAEGSIPGPDATTGELCEFALEQHVVMQYLIGPPDTRRKINAIKELRALSYSGLKEAKDAVEMAMEMMDKGYMPKSEREKVDLEAADAIESIKKTMSALRQGAEQAGVKILADGQIVPIECRCEWEASPPNIACPIHKSA